MSEIKEVSKPDPGTVNSAIEPTASEQGKGYTPDFVLEKDKSTELNPDAESTFEAGLTPDNKDNYS